MFTGSYFNTKDEKGRVFLPSKIRNSLGERIWLVKGFETCLYIFTQEEWLKFTGEYITNLTLKNPDARKLQRFILGGSRELEIDKSGRINLPQDLIDYAGITKDVVFAGCGNRVELWDSEKFEKDMDLASFDPNELMAGFAGAANED